MKARRQIEYQMTALVRDYLGNKCIYCETTKNLHVHHIQPLYCGGTNTMGNVEVVCNKCHYKLHTQLNKVTPQIWKKKDFTICEHCGSFRELFIFNKKERYKHCERCKVLTKNQ